MPTYQYACTECGERTEAVQKFTDDPLTVCEACGGRLRKVFSPVGIVFKGSGFYRTDSRSSSTAAADNGSPAKEGSKDSAKESGSKETKKETQKETTPSSSSSSSSDSGSSSSGAKTSSASSSATSSGSKVA